MTGQLDPLDGMVKRHNHLRIGQYHQHLTELLPEDKSPLEVGFAWGKRGLRAGVSGRRLDKGSVDLPQITKVWPSWLVHLEAPVPPRHRCWLCCCSLATRAA